MRWLLISFSIAVLCTYFEVTHEEYLEQSSASLTLYFQSYSSHTLDVLFKVLGEITGVLFLLASGIAYLCGYREIGVLGTYSGFFGAALSGTIKLILQRPRPFWKFSQISILSCPHDWGSPSGHALSGGAAMIVLAYFWLSDKKKKNLLGKIIILFFCTMITAVDRVYLGVHFYSQVILGYSYSMVIGCYFIRPSQIQMAWNIPSNKQNVIVEHLKILIFCIFSGAIYTWQTVPKNEVWEENYLEKCGNIITDEGVMIKNICEAMYMWIVAGMILGFSLIKNLSQPVYSKKLVIASALIFVVNVLIVVVLDKVIIKVLPFYIRLPVLCVNRYLGGFCMSYYAPQVLCKVFGESEKPKTS